MIVNLLKQKLTTGVNFTNILCAAFYIKVSPAAFMYSQTWANDHPRISTTCLQRPLFSSPNLGLCNINLPLKNDHLSTTATNFRYQGWLLYTGLTIHFRFILFWRKNIGAKVALTMLGKIDYTERKLDLTAHSSWSTQTVGFVKSGSLPSGQKHFGPFQVTEHPWSQPDFLQELTWKKWQVWSKAA